MLCPTQILITGQRMPEVGLGTSKAKGRAIENAIDFALEAGYRHFDCAQVYGNEVDIGKALEKRVTDGTVERGDLFISSKLGCSFQHPDQVFNACQRSLEDLSLNYLDLFYIHWPFGLKYNGPENFFPTDESGELLYDESIDFTDTWSAMEKLYQSGKVRAIGVCNFNIQQLQRILDECDVTPAAHQFECHPYCCQNELFEFCRSRNIAVIGYSPLCSPDRPNLPNGISLLSEPSLAEIGKKHNKTIAQVILRYQTQRGVVVIPRSTNKQRIAENINLFDFSLSSDEIAKIESLDANIRIMYPDKFSKHKYFPFELR